MPINLSADGSVQCSSTQSVPSRNSQSPASHDMSFTSLAPAFIIITATTAIIQSLIGTLLRHSVGDPPPRAIEQMRPAPRIVDRLARTGRTLMKRRQAMGAMLAFIGTPALRALAAEARTAAAPNAAAQNNPAIQLFNGKDLTGWDTWLGKPNRQIDVPGFSKTESGEYVGAVGLNRDPKGVFTAVTVDGAPAIRISGEIFG